MKACVLLAVLCVACITCMAQPDSALNADTLQEVQVAAYGLGRSWQRTPAAVNITGSTELARFSCSNVLQAINSTPGVRMEERSPGSYRFSIRGSSLRSPFGVRNVKVYYNGIPITDPSGFSYFNQLGYYQLQRLQVIKGPGSSIYGAGTGGVLLVDSRPAQPHTLSLDYETGSFNSHRVGAGLQLGDSVFRQGLRYDYSTSEGYRDHSASQRHTASWDGDWRVNNRLQLGAHLLFTDLRYETPGALTIAEYETNERSARPAAGIFPSAEATGAAVNQRNALLGLTMNYSLSGRLTNQTVIYGNYTSLSNPTIRNYGKTDEPHGGGRTSFTYTYDQWRLLAGVEYQQGYVASETFTNKGGQPDSLRISDKIDSRQLTGFLQVTRQRGKWLAEAGVGLHSAYTSLNRTIPAPLELSAQTGVMVSPRFALLYMLLPQTSLYANVARGFSSPTTVEYFPTGSVINASLQPEAGWNYELGAKGFAANYKMRYEFNAYHFRLEQAIVLRRDAGGGDSYINAGGTSQTGIEAMLRYAFVNHPQLFGLDMWASYTGSFFKYNDFVQLNENYSGKQLPGTPQHSVAAGFDATLGEKIALYGTYYFADRIALNDANTAYANAYHLLGCKLQYEYNRNATSLLIYVGADNLLDQQYSLGNDINAAGGRYYNAAPGRNYYAGVRLRYR